MSPQYAPQRRLVLSLQHQASPVEPELLLNPGPGLAPVGPAGGTTALSAPQGIRDRGDPLEPFFQACGGRSTISLAVRRRDRDKPPKTFSFQQPFVLMGRCPQADLPVTNVDVGFRHVYFQLIAGRWAFVNLARLSRVISAQNDRTSGWFDPGDELEIGPYTVRRVALQPDPVMPSGRPAALPAVALELVNSRSESNGTQPRTLVSPITLVGSTPQCDFFLRDKSVSKVHASLVSTPMGLWVVDLLGRDGVLVDDRPVYWKQVLHGSCIQIGRFRFRVKFDSKSEPGRQDLAVPTLPVVQRPRSAKRNRNRRGGLSEDMVLALIRQLAEMQSQFFEHSQIQMQFMTEMLVQLGRSQQTAVRKDLLRIDEIGRELREIQSQLAEMPQAGVAPTRADESETAPSQPLAQNEPAIEAPAGAVAAEAPSEVEPAVEPAFQTPGPEHSPCEEPPGPGRAPVAKSVALPGTAEAHSRLTRRMAKLAQERNNHWRRVLQAFKRKPDG